MTDLVTTEALGHLPQGLRSELMAEFNKIVHHYARGAWAGSELNGGRFSEVVYSILRGYVDGSYPDAADKPNNFKQACEGLLHADKERFPQSVRALIPRVLVALYDIRNNRGVGHVGGDVDANHMDAAVVVASAKWVMAELVRIFHALSVEDATAVVDALTARDLPVIWKIGERRRVLLAGLSLQDQVLLILYGCKHGRSEGELAKDLKQGRPDNFRRVLRRLDADLLVEYAKGEPVVISPKGERRVEDLLA